jgi:hypothetical protein
VKPISTRTHGILDYLTAGALLALPRALGWSAPVTKLVTGAALGTLAYSALTRYELAPAKVLPMRAHLALDGLSGALFAAAPFLLPAEPQGTRRALTGIGLFELAVVLLTRTTTPFPAQPLAALKKVEKHPLGLGSAAAPAFAGEGGAR